MFVAEGAREMIQEKRMISFKDDFITPLIKEAKNLGFNKQEIVELVGKEIENETTDK